MKALIFHQAIFDDRRVHWGNFFKVGRLESNETEETSKTRCDSP